MLYALERGGHQVVARVYPIDPVAPFTVQLDFDSSAVCSAGCLTVVEGEPDAIDAMVPWGGDLDLFDDMRFLAGVTP